jgi:putative spermidine/putrescine transport system permease protein
LLVLGVFFVAPLGTILGEALEWSAVQRLLAATDLWGAAARSAGLGLMTGLVALLVGTPVALHLANLPTRRRALAQVLIALPLTFSGLIIAYGFILLFGRAGFATLLLARLGFDPVAVAGWLYSPFGLIVAYSYFLIPRVVLILLPVLVNFDRQQIAAAQSMGAGPWRARLDIMLPQLAPGAIAAFCLVAAVAIGAYGTALALIGTQINILPLRLYVLISDANADLPLAALLSLILLAGCSALIGLGELVTGRR